MNRHNIKTGDRAYVWYGCGVWNGKVGTVTHVSGDRVILDFSEDINDWAFVDIACLVKFCKHNDIQSPQHIG
jgi:hypothetical protein